MDDKRIPYVEICRDVRDMSIRFNDLVANDWGIIQKASKRDWRVVYEDGTTVLFVTASTFFDPHGHWRQGRIYKIAGDGGRVYHGEYPLKKKEEIVKWAD